MSAKFTLSMITGSLVIIGVLIASVPAHAHSEWALPFMGGLMAGHVATNFANAQRERTEALQSMAYGGGGGYGGGSYGYGPRPTYYAAPAAPSPEQQLNTLDQLAAGGYITPQQYQERRQAILNGM